MAIKSKMRAIESLQPLIRSKIKKKQEDSRFNKALASGSSENKPAMMPVTRDPDGVVKKRPFYGITFSQLRAFADSYPIARACINHRISQVTQLDWKVAPMEVITEDEDEKEVFDRAKEVRKMLKFPTGNKSLTFRGFITQIVEDVLTIDAVAVERIRSYGDKVIGWRPFDSATIEILLYPDGSLPEPPEPAYQQKVDGKITARLTSDDIYYGKMHPRTHTPYGMSPLETLVATITTALKLQSYNLAYLQDGNVPEGFVEIPKEIASNPDQLKEWQNAWDAIFSGDPRYQRKLKFLPEGMKYHPTKSASDMTFEKFEKWLLLNTCAVFKVSPQDIGFTYDANKAIAETQWEIGKERGMMPLVHFVKEMMDQVVQDDLGHEDLEFVYLNLNPTNKLEEAKVFQILVNSGAVSVDEWRIGEGMKPIGIPHFMNTPIGPIFAKDLLEQSESGQEPAMPYGPPRVAETGASPSGNNPEGNGTKQGGNQVTNPETARRQSRNENSGKKGGSSKAEMASELKKWRKVAKNDVKSNKPFREFYSDVLGKRTKWLIDNGLQKAETTDDVNKVFDSFLDMEKNQVDGMKDLYGRINDIITG